MVSGTIDPSLTPVLVIACRRPHTVRQVIGAIRHLSPKILFVACDGADSEAVEQVAATRQVLDQEIDWPCQINRLYSDVHQGCRLSVSRAINWFFEHVEEGIILEDDCVPHPDFFPYCSTLLDRYRHDTRVWCISGNNFQNGQWFGDGSYYFSRYNHCWGWATWRQRWQHYDADLKNWPLLRDSGLLQSIFEDPLELQYWRNIWQRLVDKGEPDSWAYRWSFTCFSNSGLTALPNRNLVENVGFGQGATHTICPSLQVPATEGLDYFHPPSFILRNLAADRFTFNHHFLPRKRSRMRSWASRLKTSTHSALKFIQSRH